MAGCGRRVWGGRPTVKIVMIGCGYHSEKAHGPSLAYCRERERDVTLAACCDVREETAANYRGMFGFARHYTDWEQMVEVERPDAVGLVVPESLTFSLAERLLEEGVPLLLEKPPGLTPEQTAQLERTALRSGVPHAVGFNRRYAPLTVEAVSQLERLGLRNRIASLTYDLVRVNRRDPDFSTTAIHAIDAARHLAGKDYAFLEFRYRELPHLGAGVADMIAQGYFTDGTPVRLNVHPVAGVAEERAFIRAEGHSFELRYPMWGDGAPPAELIHNGDVSRIRSEVERPSEPSTAAFGFCEMWRDFLACVRNGRSAGSDLTSALQSVGIMACLRNRAPHYDRSTELKREGGRSKEEI